jgi:hypothetical protein
MGYATRYKLVARYAGAATPEAAIANLVNENEEAGFCLLENGESGERGKWYEHEEDLRSHSSKFPHLLFTLNGEGEESGDIWVKYFQDGKMQTEKAELRLGEFHPEKLK